MHMVAREWVQTPSIESVRFLPAVSGAERDTGAGVAAFVVHAIFYIWLVAASVEQLYKNPSQDWGDHDVDSSCYTHQGISRTAHTRRAMQRRPATQAIMAIESMKQEDRIHFIVYEAVEEVEIE